MFEAVILTQTETCWCTGNIMWCTGPDSGFNSQIEDYSFWHITTKSIMNGDQQRNRFEAMILTGWFQACKERGGGHRPVADNSLDMSFSSRFLQKWSFWSAMMVGIIGCWSWGEIMIIPHISRCWIPDKSQKDNTNWDLGGYNVYWWWWVWVGFIPWKVQDEAVWVGWLCSCLVVETVSQNRAKITLFRAKKVFYMGR